MIKIAERTFHLSVVSHLQEKKKICDLFIEAEELRKYGMLSLDKGREIFDTGYKITKEILEKNKPFESQ